MKTYSIVTLLGATLACASQPTTSNEGPASASSRPAVSADDSAAGQLGRRIVENSGFDSLNEVAQIDFDFVVTDDGKSVFKAKHRWDRKNGRARIEWKDKTGATTVAWLDVATRTAVGTIDGKLVTGADAESLSKSAYGRYINDTYWLLMPLKLFDPGTTLESEDKETVDGTTYEILRLSFEGVGLTPGDVYRLYIDDGGYRIHGWQMLLQGRKDKPRYVTWEDYKPVGPLLISHRHRIEGTKREIVMEGTLAHRFVREKAFIPPKPPTTP